MAEKVLIIGAVALGPKVATRLSRLTKDAKITLIDQDEFISYGGCGIPYYISGDVENLNALRMTTAHVLRDAKFFDDVKDVNVKTSTKALKINREAKSVLVENVITKKQEELQYDKLVLALGASPRKLPIEGADLKNVSALTNLHEAQFVHGLCSSGKIENAVIIGAGFIGLEVAVALAEVWGINVTVIEFCDQVLPTVSNIHSAQIAKADLEDLGINVVLSEKVMKLEGKDGAVSKVITDKQSIDADLVISSIGFMPNSNIAKEAGLEVIANNAIKVDEYMRTSDPNIYSGGDCCSVKNLITNKDGYLPLGSLANRQGRIIGSNLAGRKDKFDGYVGTWAVKLGKISLAGVGLTLAQAQREGFDAINAIAEGGDHAHFYSEVSPMTLELIVERKTRRILGFEAVSDNADSAKARVDAVATMLQFNPQITIDELSNAEIAYAPPFASAMDIINTVANVADNILEDRLPHIAPSEFKNLWDNHSSNNHFIVDARPAHKEVLEMQEKYPSNWLSLPLEEFKARYNEVPKDKPLILLCSSGTRSYETVLKLKKLGYTNFAGSVLGGMQAVRKANLSIN